MPSGYNRESTLDKYQKKIEKDLYGKGAISENPLYQAGFEQLMRILQGDTGDFEAPAMRQFNEQIIPQIAEQFGGIGALSSSAFQQALGGASTDLAERLAALRGNLGLQAAGLGLGYAQQPIENKMGLLNTQTQAFLPKKTPWWQNALAGITGGISGGMGMGIGGKIFGKLFG